MKAKNFPARKVARQQRAAGVNNPGALELARNVRTKKDRSQKAKFAVR